MTSTDIKQSSTRIVNIRATIWDLLDQWKAILIVSLCTMVLLTGFKYYKDIKAYNAAKNSEAQVVEENKTAEESIEEILNALPESDRTSVEFMVRQNDWIEEQKDYINNSILMNTNTGNQRTLVLDYQITLADNLDTTMSALVNGYVGLIRDEDLINGIKEAFGYTNDNKYIAELISINNFSFVGGNIAQLGGANADNAVVEVVIILPEGVDENAVQEAVTKRIKEYSGKLSNSISPHNIDLLNSNVAYLLNYTAISYKNNIMQSVFNLQNNMKNMKTTLSDSQKAAVDSIIRIKSDAKKIEAGENIKENAAEKEAAPKPGFSKKYALFGFILGAMIYAFIYLLLIIVKGCINCAADVEYYLQSRLLGEIYDTNNSTGFAKLLHSKLVENLRYRGRLNPEVQVKKTVDAIDAVCEHNQTKKFALFDLTGKNGKHASAVISGITDKGIDVELIDGSTDMEEKSLLHVDNAVFITGPVTEALKLMRLRSLCDSYDIKALGAIYVSE